MTNDNDTARVGLRAVLAGFDALVGPCDRAVAVVDSRARVLRANPRLAELASRTVEDLVGSNLADALGAGSGWDGTLDLGAVATIERGARRLELSVQAIVLEPELSEQDGGGNGRTGGHPGQGSVAEGRDASDLRMVWIDDVTEQHLTAWRMSLVVAMGEGIARADSLDAAIEVVMAMVCDATGWTFAQAWRTDGDQLVPYRSWCSTAGETSSFRSASEAMRIGRGEDIVGRVWATGTPLFLADLSDDDTFLRGSPASEVGFRSAAAFPVRVGTGVEAVIELFTTEPRPGDAELSAIAASVTAQLERVVQCHQMEERSRHAATAIEGAMVGAMIGMAFIDMEGRLTRVNPMFETIVGAPEAELLGRRLTELTHPDDVGPWVDRLDQVLSREAAQFQLEVRYIRPDLAVADALVVGSIVTGDTGEPVGCFVQMLDITARRRAEERARDLSVSLQEHVTALAAARRELQHLVGRLVESEEEERGRLAIGLHDEVLPLLTSARLSAERAMTNTGSAPSTDLEATIRALDTVAERLRDTAFHLRPRALDIEGLFAAVLEMTAGLVTGDHGPDVRVRFEGSDTAISPTVRVLAYRTVQEATRNAMNHAQARSIEIVLWADEVEVRGEVSDDGVGIDPDAYGQRLGAGHIGVASMRETILIAQGSFELVSLPGEGTTVRFSLPSSRMYT